MSYTMDKNLEEGLNLLAEGKKIDTALKLINKSARKGKTKGKSFFEVGRIVREGIPGMEGNPEDARKYYDSAMSHFAKLDVNALDCLDYREMGDYYNYALGTEEADKAKAVDYYKKAVELGDEVAKERLEQVEKELSSGSATTAPSLAAPSTTPAATPAVKEAATKTVVEEKEETYPVVEHEPIPEEKKTIAVAPSPVADVQPEPTVVTEVKEAATVAAPAPAVEEKPVEEKPAVEEAPKVEKAKEVVPEGKTLIIKEGVQIIVSTEGVGANLLPVEFTVNGNLYCEGTEEKPILFSIPEADRTEANTFAGLWGGIVAGSTCEEMLIDTMLIRRLLPIT